MITKRDFDKFCDEVRAVRKSDYRASVIFYNPIAGLYRSVIGVPSLPHNRIYLESNPKDNLIGFIDHANLHMVFHWNKNISCRELASYFFVRYPFASVSPRSPKAVKE